MAREADPDRRPIRRSAWRAATCPATPGRGLLCLGPMTACSYSDVFPLFMAGPPPHLLAQQGQHVLPRPRIQGPGPRRRRPHRARRRAAVGVKGVVWYTDLPGGCPTFTPTHAYDPADNPFYDNLPHDIVEAGSAATVPADRKGLVGGPISLLANWPEGYRLVGMFPGHLPEGVPRVSPMIGGRPTFRRLLVERI